MSGSKRASRHAGLLAALAAFALPAGRAVAAPGWLSDDGIAGRFELAVRGGGSIPVYGDRHFGGVAGLAFGVGLGERRAAWLLLPVEAQFSTVASTITVGLGFRYDIRLPVPGLAIAPRLSAGYAAIAPYGAGTGSDQVTLAAVNAGFVTPELSLRMVVSRRFVLALTPVSVPIFFTSPDAASASVRVSYRALLDAGVYF